MKLFKKIICTVLALIMALSVFAVTAGAQDEQTTEKDILLGLFKDYLAENCPDFGGAVSVDNITKLGDWTLFYGSPGFEQPMPVAAQLGNYVFAHYTCWGIPYELEIYAEKDGQIFTLKEAYETGEIDIAQVAKANLPVKAFLLGDANLDNEVTVKDVLLTQKVLAKIEKELDGNVAWLFEKEITFNYYDCNLDGSVNVQDVLQIQKTLAKAA